MKILSQSKKELYEFEGNNIFVVDDMIFISKEVNIYVGKPGILGQYKDTEECMKILQGIMENYLDDHIYITEMPAKKEEENENQQRESGNDNKV